IENCQTVVFMAYVTRFAHTLFNFRLYLQKQWFDDPGRLAEAKVPESTSFATKTALAVAMVAEAIKDAVAFAWVCGDEVYGRSSQLRRICEENGKGYVFTVPGNHLVTLASGRRVGVRDLVKLVPVGCWETRSCGRGCKGHRDYEWAFAGTDSDHHKVLIRRKISDPSDLAFFIAYSPRMVPISVLIRVAGKRWPVEECFQQAKGQTGLDQHQLRLWHSFHRHTVLAMCAHALLAIATARPKETPETETDAEPQQPEHWRDTGKIPTHADEKAP